LNMFQGKVPLEEGDVAVTTQVNEPATQGSGDLVGTVALEALGPYAGIPVALPGDREGAFILDLGASRSLVARDFLDPEIPTQPMVAVEHSAQGVRELAGTAQAAGGSAKGVGSTADVPWVRVGYPRDCGSRCPPEGGPGGGGLQPPGWPCQSPLWG
jgi:hypothetical protein